MTLKKFVIQGLKERKENHMLLLWIFLNMLILPFLYFKYWYGKEQEDYEAVHVINP